MAAVNENNDRLNFNGNNWNDNNDNHAFGIALPLRFYVETYKNFYSRIISIRNLILAYKKAKKGKTKKDYVLKFEENLVENLLKLHYELKAQTYKPEPLVNFIVRDPKTRKISKSAFRDRVVHHALIRIIELIFERIFIYDSCANRKGKGNLFALRRLDCFVRNISRNGKINGWFNNNQIKGYCLKADIKHYFEEVNHKILIEILKRKIKDGKVIWLIEKILQNCANGGGGERFFTKKACLLAT